MSALFDQDGVKVTDTQVILPGTALAMSQVVAVQVKTQSQVGAGLAAAGAGLGLIGLAWALIVEHPDIQIVCIVMGVFGLFFLVGGAMVVGRPGPSEVVVTTSAGALRVLRSRNKSACEQCANAISQAIASRG